MLTRFMAVFGPISTIFDLLSFWFLESLWSQVMILHLLRTKKLPVFQSSASRPVCLVTIPGLVLFTVLPFTPLGSLPGLRAMPALYFAALSVDLIFYLLLVTLVKKLYISKYRNLI